MNLNRLQKKNICILGLGVENYHLVKYLLVQKIECNFIICDARSRETLGDKYDELARKQNIFWQLGKGYNENLWVGDVLFRSPGWPIVCPGIREALRYGSLLYSPMRLFLDICQTKNIIGVTGTKGKGTTSSLIFEILRAAKKKVWLGGNIGVAPFSFVNKIKKNDWVVLELSSFQLEDCARSPRLAVMTNFYPEHLAPADPNNPNFHASLPAYWRAKANIFTHQKKGDWLIANKQTERRVMAELGKGTRSQVFFYDKSDLSSNLPGEHNQENIAAAEIIADIVGIKTDIVARAVSSFRGLPHRIELIGEKKGVRFYDDSFATTPEATLTAIKAFDQPKIIFLGGAEKNSDFSRLAEAVATRSVKFVVLLDGKATQRIKKRLISAGFPTKKMKLARDIESAVKTAVGQSVSGDVVLLSTACASFGMFKNYKERGESFTKEVRKYIK